VPGHGTEEEGDKQRNVMKPFSLWGTVSPHSVTIIQGTLDSCLNLKPHC